MGLNLDRMNRFIWQSLDPIDRAKDIAGQHRDLPKSHEIYRQIVCEDAEQRALEFERSIRLELSFDRDVRHGRRHRGA